MAIWTSGYFLSFLARAFVVPKKSCKPRSTRKLTILIRTEMRGSLGPSKVGSIPNRGSIDTILDELATGVCTLLAAS